MSFGRGASKVTCFSVVGCLKVIKWAWRAQREMTGSSGVGVGWASFSCQG